MAIATSAEGFGRPRRTSNPHCAAVGIDRAARSNWLLQDSRTRRPCFYAVIAALLSDHQLKCGIDDRTRLFRIDVLREVHRPFDVGEQCRDRLALALEVFRGR